MDLFLAIGIAVAACVLGAVIGYMPAIEGRGAPILHYELLIDGIPYNPLYYLS